MIEYIKGELTELSPALAVVEAHGVGYALAITLNTYTALQKTGAGHEVKVFFCVYSDRRSHFVPPYYCSLFLISADNVACLNM